MSALTETEPCSKQCYRCDNPVRMSLPEFTRDPNTWTTCKICRDKLTIEAKQIGQTIPRELSLFKPTHADVR